MPLPDRSPALHPRAWVVRSGGRRRGDRSPAPAAPEPHRLWNAFGRLMRVYGHSMAPLIKPGDLVLVRPGAYDARRPARGDVVAVRPDALDGRTFVKRIVGLPNERITVDGKEWQLGEDEFFLLGDQQDDSFDSRIFGPVTREQLIGPVHVRVWPWTRVNGPTNEGVSHGQATGLP